jgi:hypothetical protein
LSFALGNAWMYSPASRKVRSTKPSGVVIGTWKARDQDISGSAVQPPGAGPGLHPVPACR